jgi:hypothetical protein
VSGVASTAIKERVRHFRRGRNHRVLVVVDEACPSPGLCATIRRRAAPDRVEAFVIVPARGSSVTQWYVDEDAARADATARLRRCVACLTGNGIRAEGQLADPDPVQAIADALHDFAADEILLVTAQQRPSTWLRPNMLDRVRNSVRQPVGHAIVPPGEFVR